MTEAFGPTLRRLRLSRGHSLRELASMINYSAAYLSELERGKRPTMQVARRCDDALGGAGVLLALVAPRGTRATTGGAEPYGPLWPAGGGVADLGPAPGRAVADSARCEFAVTADESARFIRRSASANVELVEQLGAEVRAAAEQYLHEPADVVFGRAARLRREVLGILDAYVRPQLAVELYLLTGQLTALLAQSCSDLDRPATAESHARTAWICADLIGHDPLRAYVRWIQSQIAHWTGQHARAAQIAHDGRRYATRGTSLLRLVSQEARAAAACADADAVAEALRVADTAREVAPDADEVGVFRFDPAKAAYYAAEARLALGGTDNIALARRDAADAEARLAAATSPSPELLASARLDLAAAHLAGGSLDGAVALLTPVLELAGPRHTVPLVRRAAGLGRVLAAAPFAGSPPADEVRERIAHFVAVPATPQRFEEVS
jgi:hypothetical protein